MRPLPPVNLMTEPMRLRALTRRSQRIWGTAVLMTALLCGLTWQWCSRSDSEADAAGAMLNRVLANARREEKRLAALKARAAQIRARFATLQRMRGPQAWSQSLAFVAQAVPDPIVLTRFNAAVLERSAQQTASGTGHRASGAPPVPSARSPMPTSPVPSARSPMPTPSADTSAPGTTYLGQLHLTGFALDHIDVATFLRRLQESRLFSKVALVRSAQEKTPWSTTALGRDSTLALNFGVACEVSDRPEASPPER